MRPRSPASRPQTGNARQPTGAPAGNPVEPRDRYARWPTHRLREKEAHALTVIPPELQKAEMLRGLTSEPVDPIESGAQYAPTMGDQPSRRSDAKSGTRKKFMKNLLAKFNSEIANQASIKKAEWEAWLQTQCSGDAGVLNCWEEDIPEPTHADLI